MLGHTDLHFLHTWCEAGAHPGNATQAAEASPVSSVYCFHDPLYPGQMQYGQSMDARDRLTPGANPVSGQQESTTDRAYPFPPQCDPPSP